MILASNSVKAFRVAVVPSEFTSNIAEFGAPIIKLVSLNPKEDDKEKLPAGYTRVGWIAGLGSSIDTGYYPNHNSEILIDRSGLMDYLIGESCCGSIRNSGDIREGYMVNVITEDSMSAVVCLFGALSPQDTMTVMFPIPHGVIEFNPSGGENPFEGYGSEIAETRYSIYMSKDELRVGTESRPNPATPASIDPWDISFTLFGFAADTGSDIEAVPVPDIIFSFKVSENGIPVANMLPCIEDATGQPGFYDTVRKVFITGEEGMFFTGEAVKPTPLPTNLYIFNTCTHYSQVGEIYPFYIRRINDWNYYLNNLQIGGDENGSMFMISSNSANPTLKSFNVDLPALTNGYGMFGICTGLTSFTGELPALIDGNRMFASCTGLTSWDIELPKLANGEYMFYGCTGLTSFNVDLPSLTNGILMFAGTGLTSFNVDLPSLTNGIYMFAGTGLTSWDIELPNLTDGTYMFNNCTGLTSFTGDLPILAGGRYMFSHCKGLTSFTGDLPALTDGSYMFQYCEFTSWDIGLPNLTDGDYMFFGCNGLASWNIDLPNLTSGYEMFTGTELTSFTGDLPALTNGSHMFGDSNSICTKLDLASVQHIANTINNLAAAGKTGKLYIGMNASLRDTEDLETALAAIRAKGWTVTEMYRS